VREFDDALVSGLEKRVAAVEDDNTLEVVIRVVPMSGHYRDTYFLWGIVAALLVFLVAVFAPIVVDPRFLPIELLALGGLGGLLSRRWWASTRLVTRAERRLDQVWEGARACFVEQSVDGTRARTGVLVYVSLLEDLVVVLPDGGAAGAAPRAEWDALSKLGKTRGTPITERLDAVLDGIESLGDKHLPSDGSDNPDELPNRPVIGADPGGRR